MATAGEFLALARRLDALAVEASEPLAGIDAAAEGAVLGGTLAERAARSRAEADNGLARTVTGLASAAATARARAHACRAYTLAMEAYRTELARWEATLAAVPALATVASDGRPTRPVRPGSWADEG
jgi:hypothetical protein